MSILAVPKTQSDSKNIIDATKLAEPITLSSLIRFLDTRTFKSPPKF